MSLFDIGDKKLSGSSTAPVRLDEAMMARLDRFYKAGVKRLPDAADWYVNTFFNIQNILTVYDNGVPDRSDSDQRTFLFIDLLAATSPQANIRRNTFLTTQIFQFIQDGVICDIKMDFEAHLNNVCRALLGLPLSGQKVTAFRANLLGDQNQVTVDMWMMRVFDRTEDAPTTAEYDDISRAIRKVAKTYGVAPAQMQAALWVGIKALEGDASDTPEPFETTLMRFKESQDAQGQIDFSSHEAKFENAERSIASEAPRAIAANPGFMSKRIIGARMKEICVRESRMSGEVVDVICGEEPPFLMDAILYVRKHHPSASDLKTYLDEVSVE